MARNPRRFTLKKIRASILNMQKRYSQIIGQAIINHNDGEELAYVQDLIIDDTTAQIVGLWVKKKGFLEQLKVLLPHDIREWKVKIYVNNTECLADREDLVRIQNILQSQKSLYNKKVVTSSGIYIGRVQDYNFEIETMQIINLFVVKRFFLLSYHRRIIPRSEIVEIKPNEVVIKSDLKLAKWRKKKIIDLNSFVFTPDPALTLES